MRRRTAGDADRYMLEFRAYPRLSADGRFVDDPPQATKKSTGLGRAPEKSARKLFQVRNADVVNQRLWLDPDHGYAAVRSEASFELSPEEMQEQNPVVTAVDEFDMFRRTPRRRLLVSGARSHCASNTGGMARKPMPGGLFTLQSTSEPKSPTSCSHPPSARREQQSC